MSRPDVKITTAPMMPITADALNTRPLSAEADALPVGDALPVDATLPKKITEIDEFLDTCPMQFHESKLEEKHLRTLNHAAKRVKGGKAA